MHRSPLPSAIGGGVPEGAKHAGATTLLCITELGFHPRHVHTTWGARDAEQKHATTTIIPTASARITEDPRLVEHEGSEPFGIVFQITNPVNTKINTV
jgi:hypothetical protein